MATTNVPSGGGRIGWGWLVLVVAAFFLGRYAWNVMRAPQPGGALPAVAAAGGWVASGDAERTANASGKPILYDFNAAWCGPCQMLKHDVFDDAQRMQAVATHVVPVSVVDRYREDGRNPADVEALQQRFRIEAFPTLIVLSPTTGRFEKREGYAGPDETVRWIASSAASVR